MDKFIEGIRLADAEHLTEECCDLITTVTSFLEFTGIDEDMRMEMQDIVNRKNRARGYCDEDY